LDNGDEKSGAANGGFADVPQVAHAHVSPPASQQSEPGKDEELQWDHDPNRLPEKQPLRMVRAEIIPQPESAVVGGYNQNGLANQNQQLAM
jgi:hypothetical protein